MKATLERLQAGWLPGGIWGLVVGVRNPESPTSSWVKGSHPLEPRLPTPYDLGDTLLGPQDVAILLQAGLTSAMKSSTVVQLNQRMLLDLMASQPSSFASAVLAEIGTPGGQGSCRALTSGKI